MVFTPRGGGRRVNPDHAEILERPTAGQAACTGRGRWGACGAEGGGLGQAKLLAAVWSGGRGLWRRRPAVQHCRFPLHSVVTERRVPSQDLPGPALLVSRWDRGTSSHWWNEHGSDACHVHTDTDVLVPTPFPVLLARKNFEA